MTELKFYLLCFMIAAPHGALGSAAQSISGAPISRGVHAQVVQSISLPPDSEFVEKRVLWYDFERIYISGGRMRVNSHDECLPEAISRDAHAFAMGTEICKFYTLKHPMCNKWEGQTIVYVRKDMLSDGSPSDNATYDLVEAQSSVPDSVLRYYRIESPTILEFGTFKQGQASPTEKLQYFTLQIGGKWWYYDSPVLADPSCNTTSACSEIFFTIAPEIPASDLFILHDICGKTIQVDSGRSIYVLSHEGIGCKTFPNEYPVAGCRVEFKGAGEIMINVTFVNFRESDHCDGFTMRAVTTYGINNYVFRRVTDLCDATKPTELTSVSGKIRIEFGGSVLPRREKYGFNFQVTAA